MKDFFHHLFTPRSSNNHRAKLLHHQSLFIAILLFFLASILIVPFKKSFPQVLGESINISSETLLSYTNQKRSENGLQTLSLNPQLSDAARQKAEDMFANNYWAHNSPSGLTPWVFIKKSGYTYIYAGENLARGFSGSEEVVNAWMASPTHRENMLSDNYQEVGFAVMEGKLGGEDTVLVVEMFGGKNLAQASQGSAANVPSKTLQQGSGQILSSVIHSSLINTTALSKNVSILIIVLFILTLILDILIVRRKKIIRVVGHNTDHIVYLTILLILIALISKGVII